jgi:hypothetical protein
MTPDSGSQSVDLLGDAYDLVERLLWEGLEDRAELVQALIVEIETNQQPSGVTRVSDVTKQGTP